MREQQKEDEGNQGQVALIHYLDRCQRKTLARRTRKSTQVCKTRTWVRICDGWPNGFVNRLASLRKSQKVADFTHIQLTCDWVAKRRKTCVDLRTNLSSTKVNRPRKSKQVGGQTKCKSNTSWELALPWVESVWPPIASPHAISGFANFP